MDALVEVARLRRNLSASRRIVRRLEKERDLLREALDWISAETQEPATRDRAQAAIAGKVL